MPLLSGITGFFDKYILGYALGVASGPALEPFVQDLANEAWASTQFLPLDAEVAAAVAAEDVDAYDRMAAEATLTGLNGDRFKDLYGETLNAPGVGELITLLRRNAEVGIDFAHGLRKAKLETQWDDALRNLASARLSPQEIALGIVRSTVADPGLLAVTLDTTGGRVPAYPVWPGDALAEARTGGFDEDRLRVLVGAIGLPMSAQQAASAYFRQIIELADYNRAILEGDTRPEWAPYILEQARQILTASQYVEGHLRGWIDTATMYAGTGKHGMSQADTDLLFQISGRPITLKQITTGLARGGTYPSTYADVPEPYRKSLQEGNIRPEWASLDYANRYTYPSGFQIRAEAQAGRLTHDQTVQILLEIGWSPKWADFFAASWTSGTTAVADPHVTKAQNQLWNTVHTSYKNGEITEQDAAASLGAAGVSAAAAPAVLQVWNEERTVIRKQLTPAQIKKAWVEAVLNATTGQAWTRDDALAALIARGYSPSDAATFLEL